MNKMDRVYHFKGSPKEIGFAMGRALGAGLEQNISRYIQRRPTRPGALDMDALCTGAMPWLRSLPRRFQDEFEGLAEGANLSLQRIAEWAFVEQCVQDGCSGFVCLLDGHAWVGRNNDTFVPEMWGYVTIREVDGRIPAISFGMEGDVFTPTGINRERLWLHYHYLPAQDAPRPDKPHLPGYVLLVEALETCTTIGDVEALLCEMDRDDGMMLFAVDGKSDEFAILECTCTTHVRRTTASTATEKWLVGTNHYCACGIEMQDEDSERRYNRLEELVRALYNCGGSLNLPADLIGILADDAIERRGANLSSANSGGANFGTAYANVACPSRGAIWYTFGGFPAASHGDWQCVEWPWR